MVDEDDLFEARRILTDAGMANELKGD